MYYVHATIIGVVVVLLEMKELASGGFVAFMH